MPEKKQPGPAVRIKKYCEVEGNPVRVSEMKEFMAACKEDDAKADLPAGTTLAKLAEGIPV